MCLTILRCVGVSVEDCDGTGKEETSRPPATAATDEHAKVHPNGNGLISHRNNTEGRAQYSGKQHAWATGTEEASPPRQAQTKTTKLGATFDAGYHQEASQPEAKQEAPLSRKTKPEAKQEVPLSRNTKPEASHMEEGFAFSRQGKAGGGQSPREATVMQDDGASNFKARAHQEEASSASHHHGANGKNAYDVAHPYLASTDWKTSQTEGFDYESQPNTSHADYGSSLRAVKNTAARADAGREYWKY